MVPLPIYMDNQATTRVDPRVMDAMSPYFSEAYGNAGSVHHVFGERAQQAVDEARGSIAEAIGAQPSEMVFTSGATESNNLALKGVVDAAKRRRNGKHLISVATEHPSVLDPLQRLARDGVDVTLLPVDDHTKPTAGLIDPQQVADAIRDDTLMVSVMLANNEIGAIQPLAPISEICRQHGVLLHTDATQAVGKIPVHIDHLGVDLMSFSAHKIYGPKGTGALYVRQSGPRVRLHSQIDGGRQEGARRSGTLNVPGIVGLAAALRICGEEMSLSRPRLASMRNTLFQGLVDHIDDVQLNGTVLDQPPLRLEGNLNCRFEGVDGESLMLKMPNLAVSSGSACSAATPEPSHVLAALGLDEDQTRSSLRISLGRFNTQEEVEFAVEALAEAVGEIRKLGRMV